MVSLYFLFLPLVTFRILTVDFVDGIESVTDLIISFVRKKEMNFFCVFYIIILSFLCVGI